MRRIKNPQYLSLGCTAFCVYFLSNRSIHNSKEKPIPTQDVKASIKEETEAKSNFLNNAIDGFSRQ